MFVESIRWLERAIRVVDGVSLGWEAVLVGVHPIRVYAHQLLNG